MKRRSQRIVVAVRVTHADRPDELPCFTKNLGPGGMFVLTHETPEPATMIDLVLSYRSVRLPVRVRVAHVRDDGYGALFWNPTPETIETLGKMVRDLVTDGTPLDERRRTPRVRTSIAASWRYRGFEHSAQIADLSAAGARLLTRPLDLELGNEIHLNLPVGDPAAPEAIVGARAVVRRLRGEELGVEFVDPSDEFRSCLSQHLVPDPGLS